MHSARLVIFYLVCPRRRRRRTLQAPEICNSPLSFGIRHGADHQRQACNHSNLRTNEMLFWAREDFAQMSLEALVIVATAVEPHGPSFEKHLPRHTKTAHVKYETYRAWNIRFLNINAVSPLRNCDFYFPVLLACLCSPSNCIFTTMQYLSYKYIGFNWAYSTKYFLSWHS